MSEGKPATTAGTCPAEHGGKIQDCAAYPACGCDFPSQPRKTSGLAPTELVALEGDDIVIRITPDALTFASEHGVLCTFNPQTNNFRAAQITDLPKWRDAFVRALCREGENGDTPVHLMLDDALKCALEQGEEGIWVEGVTDGP